MIKLFGKVRYHWQPELSWLIIYWSIAITPLFIAVSLLFEKTEIPIYFFILCIMFIILVGLGFHRYFILEETDEELKIISLNPFKKSKIAISQIEKVEVVATGLNFIVKNQPSRIFYMRKWPKKYFLDALCLNVNFRGEVELMDNMDTLDYFETYQSKKSRN